MKVIWKCRLEDRRAALDLPIGAEVVHVAEQDGEPTLWVQFEWGYAEQTTRREFFVAMTGEPVENGYAYVGTAFVGSLVLHVHEVRP